LNVVLAFSSAFASKRALVQAIRRAAGSSPKMTFENGFIVCETDNPVDLASRLENTFGIERVAIARRAGKGFEELSDAIAQVGSMTILPCEKFLVKVKVGESNNYVDRDIEFASSGRLAAKLAELGAYPARREEEADRIILAFVGGKFAYVCIKDSKGLGGLPFGSLGLASCSLHSPLSLLSCSLAARTGFVTEIILPYSNDDELQANAKLSEALVTKIGVRKHTIRLAPINQPHATGLVKEAIIAQILANLQGGRIILPFTLAVHPLWFIEAIMGKTMAAGKTPYMPLMLADISNSGKMQAKITKSEFRKYNTAIDAAAKLSIKRMKRLELKVGPNYLHDILNSI